MRAARRLFYDVLIPRQAVACQRDKAAKARTGKCCQIDGDFPAHGPSPLAVGALDDLKKAVIEHGADMGVIFDGYADRVMFVDEGGDLMDTYQVFRLIQKYFVVATCLID